KALLNNPDYQETLWCIKFRYRLIS
ncbi:unnamed protein product, partial [Allacma fusca]